MATTKYGDISQRTAAWAADEMLDHAEPILVLSKFGLTKPIPKNKAEGVKFRRPVPYTVSTVPLIEGVTPTEQQIQYEDVPATLEQYGEVTIITDKVADLAEDPVLADASELSGEQAAETIEMIIYGVIKAGTNVIYCSGAAGRSSTNAAIALDDIRLAVRNLKAQRARPVTKMMSGSTDYATQPIEGGFIGFGHTDLEADIRALTGFTPVAKYGSRKPLVPEEIGSVENVRFILTPLMVPWADAGGATTTMVTTTGSNADVYPLIIIGKNCFGQVPLKGAGAITPIVLNPSPSKSDPLGQRGYVSWKAYFTAVVLNESWMVRIETNATDLT